MLQLVADAFGKGVTHSMARSLSYSELGLTWGGGHGRALGPRAMHAGVGALGGAHVHATGDGFHHQI